MHRCKKHDEHGGAKVLLGFLAGAATAAAVAGYFLFGPDKKRNRKLAEAWMEKVKDDVLSKMEDVEDLTKNNYLSLVDGVLTKYAKTKKLTDEQLERAKKTLKESWKEMRDIALESAEEAEDELDEEDD